MAAFRDLSLYSRIVLAICGLLGLVIGAEAFLLRSGANTAGAGLSAGAENSATAAVATTARPLQIPPVVIYREIVERPLFADTRRQPDKTAAAAAPTAALSSQWKLTGVVVAGKNSFVHVEGIRDHKTVRLQVGMPLDGWRLETIEADRVVFASAGRSATLRLHDEELPIGPPRRR